MSPSSTERVRGFISTSFDLSPDEHVILSRRAVWSYQLGRLASVLLGTNGRLYLTNQRIIFAPDRFCVRKAIYWPPLVTISLSEVKSVGTAGRSWGFEIETRGKQYVFNAANDKGEWVAAISRTANVPIVN